MAPTNALRWLPAVVIVVTVGLAGIVMLVRDDDPDPLAVESSAETFGSLDELAAASDLVVVAAVAGVDDGRTISAPADPDAGIRTRLLQLDVRETLVGEALDSLVVGETLEPSGDDELSQAVAELGLDALIAAVDDAR